jgi:ABC-type antimicrobial peptide transport system permease subunit
VAQDIKDQSFTGDSTYHYYVPAAQTNRGNSGVFVRVRGDGAKLQETVRARLQKEMPGASYITITPFADIVGGQMKSWTLGATMFVAFGLLALILAAVGLYSVIAYNVAQRTHELAVRVALGAEAQRIVRLVVGEGLRVALIGVVAGTGIALFVAKWVKPLLFKVSPRDPAVFAIVATVLIAVAVAACAIPAIRASRTDPNAALRAE